MDLRRRDFLRLSAVAAGLAGLGATPSVAETRNGVPYRVLGKTGEQVSLLGLGGYHVAFKHVSDQESIRIQRTAIDEGVNFFDNAYIYNDGRSEELMGKALQDGYRDKVFLMTKFYSRERDAKAAKQQLEESLRRLKTDVIDLWQVHQLHEEGHAKAVHDNGLHEVMLQAKQEGKIRYLGFTGHTRTTFLQEMIDRGLDWDTVQMPLSAMDHYYESFSSSVMRSALKKNMGIIAMKTLGGSPASIVRDAKIITARECHHYAMNLPVATVVSGMDSMEVLQKNLATVRAFKPLAQDDVVGVLAKVEEAAKTGRFETYKRPA